MLRALLLDLDGVVYRGRKPVPGAADLVRWARQHGLDILFLTNRSGRTVDEIRRQLASGGVECTSERILTSSLATARYLRREGAKRVFFIGGEGLAEALRDAGYEPVETKADHVVVGSDPDLSFADVTRATRLLLDGDGTVTLVATNNDRLVDSDSGPVPGNGAVVAAISFAARVEPVVIGKPESYLVEMALDRLGVAKHEVILIGDNPETDVRAGRKAGIETVLLRTGVGARFEPRSEEEMPNWEARDHEELRRLLSERMRRAEE